MTASVTESKLKNGTLTIDGKTFSCQSTNIRIIPPKPPKGGKSEEVLCGIVLPDDSSTDPWVLAIKAIQDFTDPNGLVQLTWDKQGQMVDFTWKPGSGALTYSGRLQLWPLEVGGDVNKRIYADAEWELEAKPTVTRV